MYLCLVFYLGLVIVTTIWFILATKYLTVYHGYIINGLNEAETVKILKWTIALLPAMLVATELGFFSNRKDLVAYQMFSGQKKSPDAGINVIYVGTHIFVLLTWIILHSRIELDHLAHKDGAGCFASVQHLLVIVGNPHASEYKMKSLRLVLVLGLGLTLLSIYGYTFNVGTTGQKNNLLIYHITVISLFPSLYVYNHKNLRTLAKKQLQLHDSMIFLRT